MLGLDSIYLVWWPLVPFKVYGKVNISRNVAGVIDSFFELKIAIHSAIDCGFLLSSQSSWPFSGTFQRKFFSLN